jgi:hypothetical protein
MPTCLTVSTLMLDIETEWTLNASLTRLSSYRKCSKRRILGRSAQATFLLPIAGTMKSWSAARGFGFGRDMGFAAAPNPQCFDHRKRGTKLPANGHEKWQRMAVMTGVTHPF